jgi:RNA polymerase sigma-70 factor (ECF subfamily)
MADARAVPDAEDPATIIAAREHLRLAFIAGLQYLPGRQRAVLLLRDVLDFPAADVATMLGTSTAAVKSALQRARARLEQVDPAPERLLEPTDPQARELLGQYMAAFENGDVAILERALRTDAAIELVGTRTWFAGRRTCVQYIAHVLGSSGDWRMVPTLANGQPAAIAHHRSGISGLGILTISPSGISRITAFNGDAELLARFDLTNH